MKKLSKTLFLFVAIIMVAQIFLPALSYAVMYSSNGRYNSQSKTNLSIQLERPDVYRIGDQYVIEIKDSDGTQGYYCLRGGLGFGNIENESQVNNTSVSYSYVADLIDKNNVKNKLTYLDDNDNSYKAICWIADNMYVSTVENADELKTNLLANAGLSNSVLTDEDIEVVEQIALWYFTNADNGANKEFVIPLDSNDSNNDPLGMTYLTINGNHYSNDNNVAFNYNRASQINKLYRYLVTHAQTENYTLGDNVQLPSLTLKKDLSPTIETATIIPGLDGYLVGPFKINKTDGNIDYLANLTCKINGEETSRNFGSKNISELALVKANGTEVLTTEEAIESEEFYVRILNTVLNIDEVNSFKLDLSYSYDYFKTIATVWTAGVDDQPVLKVEKEKVEDSKSDSLEITPQPKKFDLSLRKFITKINGEQLTGNNDRTPNVYTDSLKNGRINEKGELEYTATYIHPKNELTLNRGDIITYTIRIYNEGDLAGTATKVTDYLPEGLIFLPENQTNINYGWTADGQKITTTYLGDNNIAIPGYNSEEGRPELPSNSIFGWQQSKDGTDGLYYVDLPIVCKISDTVEAGKSLRNIAEITKDNGDDRDSTPGNADTGNYKPGDDNSTYQEDDDDYERVKVEEFFDLALRKYISSVKTGGTTTTFEDEGTRNPNEDTSKLNTVDVTTADYKHQKNPVVVETGSLVNYKLVIYNEGDVAGRATKVIDQLPKGLKFKKVVRGNFESDGTYTESTNTLTLVRMDRNEDDLAPFNGEHLDSETIEIQCEVTAEPNDETNKVLTNIAWIAEYYNDKGLPDRDSNQNGNTPNMPVNLVTEDVGYINASDNNGKDLENPESYFIGQEDDDDFEKIVIKPLVGLYDIVLVKEDSNGEQLHDTATFEVDGVEKQVTGKLTIVKDKKIMPSNVGTVDTYIIKETVPPDKYCAFEGTIKIEVYKKKDGQKYVVDSIKYYVDNVEVTENRDDLDVYLNTDGNIYVNVVDYQFDLALRKYISKIERNGKTVGPETSRVPGVDTSTLETGTTARYIHPKDALTVKHGDIITYKLRVYNEGEVDGYATEIKDYLPSGLGFIIDEELNPYWSITSPNEDIDAVRTKDLTINGKGIACSVEGKELEITNTSLDKSLIKKYGAEVEEGDLWQQSENDENDGLFYREVEITCVVLADNTYEGTLKNIAEISKDKGVTDNGTPIDVDDRDSEGDNVWDDGEHKPGNEDNGYTPGEQDDDDFEPVELKYFDLALRKFITNIKTGDEEKEVTSRIPEFTGEIDKNGNYIYDHPKDPVYVLDKDIVTYTIRIFNEGTIAGYAEEIEDDIPAGLIFLPENDINKEYRWVMYRPAEEDEEIAEEDKLERNNKIYVKTDDVEKATIIRTDYLSSDQEAETGRENIIGAFDKGTMTSPDYKDVKVAFKISQKDIPEENEDRIIINKAQITEDSDDDEDSTPDSWIPTDDDQDTEKVYVKEFDLALYKWVTKTIVAVDGKTTETETGFKPNIGHTEGIGENYRENSEPEPIASVTLDKKKLRKTVVKFEYNIKVINEGDVKGYATEITDYIPEGLEFVQEDNNAYGWTLGEKEGTITTRVLETVLLKPGESATIPVIFTWKNDSNNLGVKKNVAAITEDYNEYGVDDNDSTPGNEEIPYDKEQEDDDDYALVILQLKTGNEFTYIGLVLAVIVILTAGTIAIKKYVL